MFCSCRISIGKCLARSLCNSRATCSRWRPSAILDLLGAYLDHQQWVFEGLYNSAKFGYDRCSSFYKPPAHRCLRRQRQRRQRQHVTEGTAMAHGMGPISVNGLLLLVQYAEAIQMPFYVVGRLGPRNCILDGHAHQGHLANTIERLCAAAVSGSATRGGDAACFQII